MDTLTFEKPILTIADENRIMAEIDQKARALVPPTMNPKAIDSLQELAWNELFSWLTKNAPGEIVQVARGIEFLDYLSRQYRKHDGLVPQDLDEETPSYVLSLINVLAALDALGAA